MVRSRKLTVVVLALTAGLLFASAPAAQAATNVRIRVHMDFVGDGCYEGTFTSDGAINDRGTAKLCDRRFVPPRTLIGTQNLDGADHYELTYKVNCNADFSVCDGNWQIKMGQYVGRGTTHQVATENPSEDTLDAVFTGTIE